MSAPARLDGLSRLDDRDIEREFTRFLTTTPEELRRQLAEIAHQPGPLDLISSISPRPVLIVQGSADEWVPPENGRELRERAGAACRYAELPDANHAFSRHRAELRELVIGWLTDTGLASQALGGPGMPTRPDLARKPTAGTEL